MEILELYKENNMNFFHRDNLPVLISIFVTIIILAAFWFTYEFKRFELERIVIQSAVERGSDPMATACALNINKQSDQCDKYLIIMSKIAK